MCTTYVCVYTCTVGPNSKGGKHINSTPAPTCTCYNLRLLTIDTRDTLLLHPLREGSAGLPVAVLLCVVPDNQSSGVDLRGLEGFQEPKLVLLLVGDELFSLQHTNPLHWEHYFHLGTLISSLNLIISALHSV